MNWLDNLLAGKVEEVCPPCPPHLKPSPHEDSRGDNRLVPDLSPTCPLTSVGTPRTLAPETEGQATAPGCPLVLFPIKPSLPLDLILEGTKGTKRTRLEQARPLWDRTLEARCAAADPEEARYLREERAGILEFEGGMSRGEAGVLSLACTLGEPACTLSCRP